MSSSSDALSVPGQVMLRGLRCRGRHGDLAATAVERLFVVDVALDVDLGPVSESDSYADVVDLADLAAAVREIIGGPPRLLLETVAVDVARLVLKRYPSVSRVSLRLAKPEPPDLDAAEEVVEVALDRHQEV
jgi:7,8-dihydroneopterin aldolase/epimerase/oxygenase